MDEESPDRQLNIHVDPEHLAGVYANFATVSFSDYEFTITFARDRPRGRGRRGPGRRRLPGQPVTRSSCSELIDAMEDSWSKWTTREGIQQPSRSACARD